MTPNARFSLCCSTAGLALVILSSDPLSAQESVFDLGSIIIDWDNVGRPLEETSAGNSVIDSEAAEAPKNTNLFDALEGQPNVNAERGEQLPVIRGIDGTAGQVGVSQFTSGSNPRVNIVVDGVSRVSTVSGGRAGNTSTWDVEQIEVARGPQTTVGGRSSLAGAINVVTKDPIFGTEGAARLSFETRNGEPLWGFSGLYNTTVNDQVALRFSLDGNLGKSFINITDPVVAKDRDEIEDIQNGVLRAKALFAPADLPGLEIVFSYEHEEQDLLSGNEVDLGSTRFELRDFVSNNTETRLKQDIFSLRARYELSSAWTLEGRVSYTDLTTKIPDTNPNFDLRQDFQNTQAEVLARYTGAGFVRRGVIGLAYEHQEEDGSNDTLGQPLGFRFDATGELDNRSIFGEIEVALSDTLFGIVGGRYEVQDISREVDLEFFGTAQAASETDDARFSPKIGLRYQPNDWLSLGYEYSEGYRPGSVDYDIFVFPAVATSFDGETLRQHEIWARYADPGNRFNLNAAAFFYNFDDVQVSGAGPNFLIGNLPKAEGYGIEVSGDVAVGENGVLFGSVGLVNTEITDAGSDPDVASFQGESLPLTTGQSLSIGYRYASPAGWDVGIEALYIGDRAPSFIGGQPLPDYTRVDIAGGYDMEILGQPVRLDVFVTNLFDEEIIIDQLGPTKEIAAPRTIGVAATARF